MSINAASDTNLASLETWKLLSGGSSSPDPLLVLSLLIVMTAPSQQAKNYDTNDDRHAYSHKFPNASRDAGGRMSQRLTLAFWL
jgi:hypothetical protein